MVGTLSAQLAVQFFLSCWHKECKYFCFLFRHCFPLCIMNKTLVKQWKDGVTLYLLTIKFYLGQHGGVVRPLTASGPLVWVCTWVTVCMEFHMLFSCLCRFPPNTVGSSVFSHFPKVCIPFRVYVHHVPRVSGIGSGSTLTLTRIKARTADEIMNE